jgi:GNAT superfamily N-acetyltransferase
MSTEQTVWRVRATVTDTPGSLAALAASFAWHGMNIVSVQVHGMPAGAVDEFLVEVPATATTDDVLAAVSAGGGTEPSAMRADVRDLVDVPTHVLTVVARTLAGGTGLPEALRAVLGVRELSWSPADTADEGADGPVLRLADPEGGTLELRRDGPAFTPAEFARARALVDLDHQLAARAERTVLLTAGEELTVRTATRADVPEIVAMHARCGPRTRRRRYLTGTPRPADAELRRMVNRRAGHTLLALRPDGAVVAMGNLVWDGDTGEVALLVEDAWQRRGVGAALLGRLLRAAASGGVETCYALTETTNTAMIRLLRRHGAAVERTEPGVACLTIRPVRADTRVPG